MAYLGNTPTSQSFTSNIDYYSGTGSATAFTLSRSVATINDILVVVDNVVQRPTDAYTLSGSVITFTSAPLSGTNNIYVRYMATTTQVVAPAQNSVSYSSLTSDMQGNIYGFKNRIINGAMVLNQRGFSGNAVDNTYTLDRFVPYMSQSAKFTIAQSSTAATGFSNSLLATSLSAYAVLAGDYFVFSQQLEGYNVADLAFGTASAATVTLSFWVRSSLTGTFGGALKNLGTSATRSYPFTYTINAANTFEQKTITIAGDTSGTWATTNGTGMCVNFGLGVGTTFSGTAGAWAGANYLSATGATSVVGTNGATFYITGVQLEKGSTATSFDYRPYGTELALCQRYYQKTYDIETAPGSATNNGLFNCATNFSNAMSHITKAIYPVPMRIAAGTILYWDGAGNASKITSYPIGTGAFANNVTPSGAAVLAQGQTGVCLLFYAATGFVYFLHYSISAEL
jgi:hypothetical protein